MRLHMPSAILAIVAAFAITRADAMVISVNYQGTVDATVSFPGGTLPQGIVLGSAVSGSFTFDTADAQAPTFDLGSCSGNACGGDSVTGNFAFPAQLKQSVTIAGHTWTSNLGQVWLLDDYLIANDHFEAVGVDSSLNGVGAEISVSHTANAGAAPLFPSVNSLDGIDFHALSGWAGTIDTGPNGYYISFAPVMPVPEPGGLGLLLLAAPMLCRQWHALFPRPVRTV